MPERRYGLPVPAEAYPPFGTRHLTVATLLLGAACVLVFVALVAGVGSVHRKILVLVVLAVAFIVDCGVLDYNESARRYRQR